MESRIGSIEVICGSMFSGKTEEMIRRLRRALIAKKQVQVFKPIIDTRYSTEKVTSHAGMDFNAQPVNKSDEILPLIQAGTVVVGIDEAQFFDAGILEVVEKLAESGIRVIVNGLDTDFRAEPFGAMPVL